MNMEAVLFDTLKLAKRLEASGLTAEASAGMSEALADVLSTTSLATKADVIASEKASRADIQALEKASRADIQALEKASRADMQALEKASRADMQALEKALRADMQASETGIRADMRTMETSIRHDIQMHVATLLAEIKGLDARMELLRRDMTVKVGGMMIAAVGIILAAMRYMPPRL
jgi:hypothetical protein